MLSLSLLVRSSPKPSWSCMRNRVWEERYYSHEKSEVSWRYAGTWDKKGRKLLLLWNVLVNKGSPQWLKRASLLLLSKSKPGRSQKLRAAPSHLCSWESHGEKKIQMEVISKLIKMTGSQHRFAISNSHLTIVCFQWWNDYLWMTGVRWQSFMPSLAMFWTLSPTAPL